MRIEKHGNKRGRCAKVERRKPPDGAYRWGNCSDSEYHMQPVDGQEVERVSAGSNI